MDEQTKKFILNLIEKDGGNYLKTARWMRDHLRVGGLKICREMVKEAMEVK